MAVVLTCVVVSVVSSMLINSCGTKNKLIKGLI